jgi:hypothetical protein
MLKRLSDLIDRVVTSPQLAKAEKLVLDRYEGLLKATTKDKEVKPEETK